MSQEIEDYEKQLKALRDGYVARVTPISAAWASRQAPSEEKRDAFMLIVTLADQVERHILDVEESTGADLSELKHQIASDVSEMLDSLVND